MTSMTFTIHSNTFCPSPLQPLPSLLNTSPPQATFDELTDLALMSSLGARSSLRFLGRFCWFSSVFLSCGRNLRTERKEIENEICIYSM